MLTDEGLDYLFTAAFRQDTQLTQVFLRLCDDSLEPSDTLLTVQGEPSGNGYAPVALNCDGTDFPTLGPADTPPGRRLESVAKLFTAAGGAIPAAGTVNTLFLASSADNSGILIGYIPLKAPRQLLDGDSLQVTWPMEGV